LGHLAQETAPAEDESVLELAISVSPEMAEALAVLRRHGKDEPTREGDLHQAQAAFDELGGHRLEAKAKRILAGLAFREGDANRPARELSGGWIMRAHLARLLTQEPDLLMLDEPTNHLDLESLLWFQNYLRNYPGAVFLISHDREFLNQTVGHIVEISQGQLHQYRGTYDEYVAQKAARQAQHWAAYQNQQREIESLQRFADRFRAKASKASQAQSKLKQIERMVKIEAPVQDGRGIRFRFPQPPRSGLKVITLAGVRQAYGNLVVYEDLHFAAERGQRTVLVGPNGAGKSTLLKILAGITPIEAGKRDLGHEVKVGYYSQHRVDMLEVKRTVLEEVMALARPVSEEAARTVLGSFLFRGDDVFKRVGVLSGGEKSRLALVKLLLDPPNFLLMDEPTTHLDMPSIEALIEALRQFEGTLVFVSHDVHFIRKIASTVLHIHAGRLTPYAGDYQYYLEKSRAVSERGALVAEGGGSTGRLGLSNMGRAAIEPDASEEASRGSPATKTKEQKRQEAEQRQARSRRRQEGARRLESLEEKIHALEAREQEIVALLQDPATYQTPARITELNRELATLKADHGRSIDAWEREANALEVETR